MCVRRSGGLVGCYWGLARNPTPLLALLLQPKSEKSECRRQGTLVRFGRRALRSGAMHSVQYGTLPKGHGGQKEGVALLGDG